MRKRRVWILAVAATVAVISVAAYTTRSDELDFLRKYPHEELVVPSDGGWATMAKRPGVPTWVTRQRWIYYADPPQALMAELEKRAVPGRTASLGGGGRDFAISDTRKGSIGFDLGGKLILVVEEPNPSWFAQKWAGVKKLVGFKEPDIKAVTEAWVGKP